MAFQPMTWLYSLLQYVLSVIFSPEPPAPGAILRHPKMAIIGAGLTGVSTASHCVGHGFDVTLFEAGGRDHLGGIWTQVNSTSGLQIHSVMYRFHPKVKYDHGYPKQNELVTQIEKLWKYYGLDEKTQFHTPVEKVYKDEQGKWIINSPSNGRFDGVIAAVGTCGEPRIPHLPGQDVFEGEICHSSNLDGKSARGKKVVIVGGGASAVEALEWATETGAAEINVLARSEKWIIPKNVFVNVLLAFNVFGQETIFSWLPEILLRLFFYRDLRDISPSDTGLFESTPMVNSEVLQQIRVGKARWLRGDIQAVKENCVQFNHRARGVPEGGVGQEILVDADFIIMATGYNRPSLSFLPEDVFEEPYGPPRWYLQVFPPQYPSICCTNCTYIDGIGTAGNYHIGIYTRLLLMFLVDPLTTPKPFWMRRWIDMTSMLKSLAPTSAFDFFTYAELVYWFCFVVLINPFRWKWALFVFCGIGTGLPARILESEDCICNGLGYKKSYVD